MDGRANPIDARSSRRRSLYEARSWVYQSETCLPHHKSFASRAERMSGVKRSANTLGTPKSSKKKKALQDTTTDPDKARVMTSESTEFPKSAKSMNETQVSTPVATRSEFGPPFDGLYEQDMALELPDTMPPLMRFRYQLLLEKARPEDRMEGTPPHLSWLETKYGHLVEKPVWYNRVVKMANAYMDVVPRDERGIKDKTLGELENAVGHLVPYTEGEKEFLQLLEKIKKNRVQLAGEPDLQFLRKQHSNPSHDNLHTNITKAALDDILTEPVSPDPLDREDMEASQCLPTEEAIFSCFNATPFTPQIRVRMYVFQLGQDIDPSFTLDSLKEPSSPTESTP